eukprot:6207782-Pleurochrysis_carterae.AAC.1
MRSRTHARTPPGSKNARRRSSKRTTRRRLSFSTSLSRTRTRPYRRGLLSTPRDLPCFETCDLTECRYCHTASSGRAARDVSLVTHAGRTTWLEC